MSIRPRAMAAICIVLMGLLGFMVSGPLMVKSFIGLDPAAFPAGDFLQAIGSALIPSLSVSLAGVVLTFGILGVGVLATFVLVRASVRAAKADDSRRSFLAGSLAGAAGAAGAAVVGGSAMASRALLGVGNEGRGWDRTLSDIFGAEVAKTHPDWKDAWRGSRVQHYGRLGRTEWPISDTVLGTGPLQGEEGERIVQLAIERGINYLDTAPDYSGSSSEQIVGRAIKGLRNEIFLTTKFCSPTGHMPAGTPVARYKEMLEDSLRRLQTDHVDLIHVHSCDEVDRLMDPNMHEAFDRLKQEGKVRFLGFSSHTPNLVQVADRAIDSGRFDVMMLAYHHGIWPRLNEVIHRARVEQDMGIVAMKTLKGAKHRGLENFSQHADSYAQAALKWVHGNPDVSCAVISFFKMQHIDEYLYASGKKVSDADIEILAEYDRQIEGSYCSPHCGDCLSSCPMGVAIADILRHRMYFEDYGNEKEAMRLYSQLPVDASACIGCSAPCAGSCSHGLEIQERTVAAHELLKFS